MSSQARLRWDIRTRPGVFNDERYKLRESRLFLSFTLEKEESVCNLTTTDRHHWFYRASLVIVVEPSPPRLPASKGKEISMQSVPFPVTLSPDRN